MIRTVWKRHPMLSVLFGLALIATLVFGVRALMFFWTLSERAGRPVAAWMTPRYIVWTYGIETDTLARILRLPDDDIPHAAVGLIAQEQGRPVHEVMDEIAAAVQAARDHGE
ncbi:MAG: hypothetical protein V4804_01005 [Pseudomonadota bacterium]